MKNNADQDRDILFEAAFAKAIVVNFDEELNTIPSRIELERAYSFSDAHERRMRKLFSQEERRSKPASGFSRWGRFAASILIFVSVLFGAFLAMPEVRAAVRDVIIEWFDRFTKFTSGASIESAVAIEWRPSFLPDGFAEQDAITTGDTIHEIIYRDSSGTDMTFMYQWGADGSTSLDNEGMVYSTTENEGELYHLYQAQDARKENGVTWSMHGYRFVLQSQCSIDDLLKVALSANK